MAVLFSGGLDSMILAALLDECLDPNCKCCNKLQVLHCVPLNVMDV